MALLGILTIAFAAMAAPALAASPTPPVPPAQPSVPVIAFEKAQKATPPIRLRSPLMLDDRRIMPPGRYDSGTSKPNPKDGGGPEIG